MKPVSVTGEQYMRIHTNTYEIYTNTNTIHAKYMPI